MKKFIKILMLVLLVSVCRAKSLTSVPQVEGTVLHSVQAPWVIVESENSGDTQADALGDTERTKKTVDRLIAAAANNDDLMSIFPIPAKWNGLRFRCIGITDGQAITHQIYFGTLGGGLDCELTYVGQLAWTLGLQQSIYDQIAFTLGGADGAGYIPQPGDTVTGNSSTKTAVIVSIAETASTWSAGTAAGTITYRSASGTFTNSETVSISRAGVVLASNALKHTSSDLIDFELADTLTVTSKSWGSSWTSVSPADDTNAEAEIDRKNADILIIVTSAAAVDAKLLVNGY